MKSGILGALALAGVFVAAKVANTVADHVEADLAKSAAAAAKAYGGEAEFLKELYGKAWEVVRDHSSRERGACEALEAALRAIGRNVDLVGVVRDGPPSVTVKGKFWSYALTVESVASPVTGDRELKLSIKGLGDVEGFSIARAPSDAQVKVAPQDFIGKSRRTQADLLAEAALKAFGLVS